MLPVAAEYVISGAGAALEAAGTGAAIDGTIADALGSKAFNGVGNRIIGTALGAATRAVENYKHVSGSQGRSSTKREPVISTQQKGKNKKLRTGVTLSAAGRTHSAVDNNAYFSRDRVLDGALVEQAGSQKLTTLQMKVGKKEYVNPIPNFLANLTGRGSVTSEWGGILSSADRLNERGFFMTMFRHRLTGQPIKGQEASETATVAPADANVQSVPYGDGSGTTANGYIPVFPTGSSLTAPDVAMNEFILYPKAPPIYLGDTSVEGSVTSMYHNHGYGRTFWSPLNRADYEDMSWNLNKLKLGQNSVQNNKTLEPEEGPTGTYFWPGDNQNPKYYLNENGAKMADLFADQTSLFRTDAHRKQSAIQINNQWNEYDYNEAYQNAPYKYNMCFNGGVIDYNFQNMEDSPCKVTVVVYKVKKTAELPATLMDVDTDKEQQLYWPDVFFNRDLLVDPIGEAYVQNNYKELGTDNLEGRAPQKSDVWAKPEYPFLPELKRTIQSALPYKEVMRNEFAMPSGAHRHVVINLPGDIYDPANTKNVISQTFDYTPGLDGDGNPQVPDMNREKQPYPWDSQPILDDHSYMVVIACSGMVGPRFYTKAQELRYTGDTGDPKFLEYIRGYNEPVGTNFGNFNLQYTCRYTEDISGCLYKSSSKKKIYVQGKAIDTTLDSQLDDGVVETQQVIIPKNHGIRLPNTNTVNEVTNNSVANSSTGLYSNIQNATTTNSGTIGGGNGLAPTGTS